MDSDNHIVNDAFNKMQDHIKLLEKYAIIGMMSETLTHGFNSGVAELEYMINDLPEKHSDLKNKYNKTMGLLTGMLRNNYISSTRSYIKPKDFKEFFNGNLVDSRINFKVDIDENAEWFVHKSVFLGIIYELITNAIRYGTNVEVVIKKKFVKVSNEGKAPSNPDKVFELGYSEKRGGSKGFGLYISRRLLNEMDFELSYRRYSDSKNVFVIKKK